MKTRTLNKKRARPFSVTFPEEMFQALDVMAQKQHRTRSEILREVFRKAVLAKQGANTDMFVDPFMAFTEWDSEADKAFNTI